MNDIKRCIFHVPNNIDRDAKSGSSKRPLRMIEAFKENGYIVDVVMGYAKERRKQIAYIKKNIENGIKYDFLYSESSTMPTALTEKKHLPIHPFLDFSFFKYCKRKNIKIGLFYRDIHWMFSHYKNNVAIWKRFITIPFYKYDLYRYRKLIDVLYLVSNDVKKYLPAKNKNKDVHYKIGVLPPGCEIEQTTKYREDNNKLGIFYVGGISNDLYNFKKLFEVVKNNKKVSLKICCREDDWNKVKNEYEKYLGDNIIVVHLSGEELKECYEDTDICSLLFNENEYMKMAMPVKTFEYLSYDKPIIATEGTASGKFVEKNKIGWTIKYDTMEIKKLIDHLVVNRSEIQKVKEIEKNVIKNNTWNIRAKKVANDLSQPSDLK